jgi:hypothetical protein
MVPCFVITYFAISYFGFEDSHFEKFKALLIPDGFLKLYVKLRCLYAPKPCIL